MKRRHGITTQTSRRLVLDAGVLVVNYGLPTERKLGATRGGSTWSLKRTVRKIPVDGARGPIKGMVRIESVEPSLEINVLELTKQNIRSFIAGSQVDEVSNATHDVITGREILPEDYFDNIALLATISGNPLPIVLILKNALAQGDWSLQLQDKNEANPKITFAAHYDPEKISEEPWDIFYPKEGDPMAHYIQIAGIGSIDIPLEGSTEETYTATVTDQFGDPWDGNPTFNVQGSPTGISVTTSGVVTIQSTAIATSFTLRASFTSSESGTIYGYKTINLVDLKPAPTTVIISGDAGIELPISGATTTQSYTAIVYDQYSDPMPGATPVWAVTGTGTSISQSGVLTVTDQASVGTIVVSASVV